MKLKIFLLVAAVVGLILWNGNRVNNDYYTIQAQTDQRLQQEHATYQAHADAVATQREIQNQELQLALQ